MLIHQYMRCTDWLQYRIQVSWHSFLRLTMTIFAAYTLQYRIHDAFFDITSISLIRHLAVCTDADTVIERGFYLVRRLYGSIFPGDTKRR